MALRIGTGAVDARSMKISQVATANTANRDGDAIKVVACRSPVIEFRLSEVVKKLLINSTQIKRQMSVCVVLL